MEAILGKIFLLFVFFVLFTPFERLFVLHRTQRVFRRGLWTDICYFLFNGFVTDFLGFIAIAAAALILGVFTIPSIQTFVQSQPFLIQFVAAVVIANTFAYFSHRLAHTLPFLWKFHSVHHSSESLDWIASVRAHPVDQIFNRIFVFSPLFFLGFRLEVFGLYFVLSLFHGVFIHMNVRFRFRFLRGILTTPHYHHWHHSNHVSARNKNFAGQFPILDLLFGTYYYPREITPFVYGIDEAMPKGYFSQLIKPFRRKQLTE